jgi:ESCRT-I complex subunit TSG101
LSSLLPDSVVFIPPGPHSQLVDAYALDSSIDDSIYYLGEALRIGVMDCEVYLKKVRWET